MYTLGIRTTGFAPLDLCDNNDGVRKYRVKNALKSGDPSLKTLIVRSLPTSKSQQRMRLVTPLLYKWAADCCSLCD
jgi:hypothetical protein